MPELTPPPAWIKHAICAQVDTELFFPKKGGNIQQIKRICNGHPLQDIPPCPVRAACLDYALVNHEEFGIWGGLSYHEREALQQEREAA